MPRRRSYPKTMVSLVVVLLLVLSSMPAMAKKGQTYYCVVEGLTVYQKASTKSASVGTLGMSDPVIHLGTRKGMWRVRARGGEGYVKPKSSKGDFHLASKPLQKDGVYVVKGIKRLALRAEPVKSAAAQGVVRRYTAVKLKKVDGYWGYVVSQDGSAGWARLRYLKSV